LFTVLEAAAQGEEFLMVRPDRDRGADFTSVGEVLFEMKPGGIRVKGMGCTHEDWSDLYADFGKAYRVGAKTWVKDSILEVFGAVYPRFLSENLGQHGRPA